MKNEDLEQLNKLIPITGKLDANAIVYINNMIKREKINLLKEIIEETYNDEFFDSLNICLNKLEKLEK
jgi:nitrogen regulatory protein PII-like uncharacterized protein